MALRPLPSRSVVVSFALGLTIAVAACAESDSGTDNTGSGGSTGSTGSGGSTGAGGSTGNGGTTGEGGGTVTGVGGTTSGGTTGAGGQGGSTPTGGNTGAGGGTATGGTTGAGGKGGSTGAGGTASGGTTGAGGTATGGTTGAGGKGGTTGAGGTATGGTTGAGGKGGTTATGGTTGAGGATAKGGSTGAGGSNTSDTLIGWAQSGCSVGGISTTTGGGSATPISVTSATSFNSNIAGTTARVLQVSGSISGNFNIGSNKTIIGMSGAKITGNLTLNGSSNVIIQNLTIVGLNCSDVPSNGDCQDGEDAITVEHSAHHIWIDHLDVSDGSDGNLDITDESDCVTVSWTKFHYSANRASGYTGEVHHFSNLIGASDTDTSDEGHLRVTWHHDWWATDVVERMPRARFGDVHVFNSLYTASGDDHCVEVGVNANILLENNVFVSVKDPIDTTDYSNSSSIAVSRGDIYTSTSGQTANKGSAVFTPGYSYTLDAASSVQSEVQSNAGPH